MERLTERFSNGQAAVAGCGNNCKYDFKYCEDNFAGNCPTLTEIYEKLAKYEELEEQGRLIRLPCKVGDKVYSVECNEIKEFIVSHFDICMKGIYAYQDYIFIGQMGFSVFLTKEEAEKALEMEK